MIYFKIIKFKKWTHDTYNTLKFNDVVPFIRIDGDN